ncbi:NADH dehydrogenase FAD-containing subunit [Paenibacillus hamazuiensis]|uniref:NADH dehydrogenase FAD-containing subunit n=1 Tax=Paenibacillus hamazuiensis TaxID=2936508 RepID=UPI00200E6911|nr:NADH dehydrogenase FAD-containing subunit [Paenibacillus hamazuiensis]
MLIEWQKLLKNKATYISLSALILVVGLAAWSGAGMFRSEYDVIKRVNGHFPDAVALISPHQYWIGLSNAFFSSFYYFIFPLLVALPIVDTIYNEQVSGNLHYQMIRTNRRAYFWNKFIFTFVISFVFFVIPLLIGVGLVNLLTGTWDYTGFSAAYDKLIRGTAVLGDSTSLSLKKELFSDLLSVSPYAYIMVYYIIGGLYAGAYSCFGLALSFFVQNRYLILIMPLCLYLGGWMIFTLLRLLPWDPFNFLDPRQPVNGLHVLPVVIDFGMLMLAVAFLYMLGVRKTRDILA